MKLATTLTFLIILSLVSYSQNIVTDSSVTCFPYWKKGESRNVIIESKRWKWNKNVLVDSSRKNYESTITVIDSLEDGYILEWDNSKMSPLPETQRKDDLLDGILVIFKHRAIRYHADRSGFLDSLINYAEFKHILDSALALEVQPSGMSNDSTFQNIKNALSSRQGIENVLLRDISKVHMPYGAEFTDREQQFETLLPHGLGGNPIPALLTYRKVKADKKSNIAIVQVIQEIDRDKLIKMLKDMANSMLPNEEFKEEKMAKEMIRTDHMTFEYYISSGWMKKLTMIRNIKVDGVLIKEQTDITLR